MINKFIVKAIRARNELLVVMDGYFLNSEIDLAVFLINKEIRKLIPGFTMKVDIRNLIPQIKGKLNKTEWIDKLARSKGAGEIRYTKKKNYFSVPFISFCRFLPIRK